MYSGSITAKHTINWLGTHQKFNKVAYRLILPYVNLAEFPTIDAIIHFEGYNGPDGLKVKSAGQHEPKHFYDPIEDYGPVIDYIDYHYKLLVRDLKAGDRIRAAFEASWLAHTITDGLTPAHHYPYEDELKTIHQASDHTVLRARDKMLIRGKTRRQTVRQNWQMWGSKGLLSTHIHFEMGVAAAVLATRFTMPLNKKLLHYGRQKGAVDLFKAEAKQIARYSMYERFYKTGWTVGLARIIKRVLAPNIAQTIAVIWTLAAEEAGIGKH